MYSKSLYGVEKYGEGATQNGVSDEYFIDLACYAPPFLAEIRELAELYRTEGYTIGQLQHDLEEMRDQCFVPTATWSLNQWEKMYGIDVNLTLSFEQRREIIAAKIRGKGTTTKQMIEDTAAAFSGGEVEVIEDNLNYHFIVRFIGIKGIPRNMQAFIAMLEEIKPAHLKYTFEYTYTTWNSLRPLTCDEISDETWDSLRIMREIEYHDGTWSGFSGNNWNSVVWKTWEEIGKE